MVEDSAAGEAYIGTKCIRIRSTAASGDGAAYQNLTVKAGKRYVFSAYVKASVSELAAKGRIWLQIEDTAKNLAVVAVQSASRRVRRALSACQWPLRHRITGQAMAHPP